MKEKILEFIDEFYKVEQGNRITPFNFGHFRQHIIAIFESEKNVVKDKSEFSPKPVDKRQRSKVL